MRLEKLFRSSLHYRPGGIHFSLFLQDLKNVAINSSLRFCEENRVQGGVPEGPGFGLDYVMEWHDRNLSRFVEEDYEENCSSDNNHATNNRTSNDGNSFGAETR